MSPAPVAALHSQGGAGAALSQIDGGDQPSDQSFLIPSWVPEPVAEAARALQSHFGGQAHDQLVRLVTDDSMEEVWKQLSRERRQGTGFFFQAKVTSIESADPIAHQHAAMASLLYFAVSLAASAPRVVTRRQIDMLRGRLLDEAETLKSAAEFLCRRAPTRAAVDAVEAVLEAARVREAEPDLLVKAKTQLIVKRDTGDPAARCFAILFADRCQQLFGKRLDGVTATVASVALAREVTPRAVREWTSERVPRRKPKRRF